MRVMFDTNILISAVLFAGKRTSNLTIRIADEYTIVLSTQILDELKMVIARKFPDKMPAVERFLKQLNYEVIHTPAVIDDDLFSKMRDKKDYPILVSAIAAQADVFITGDNDFDNLGLERPEIMTVSEFEQKYL